jgi:tetratricopeptide (TPR) repeat protein
MDCALCEEREYDLKYCLSCYKLVCGNCYKKIVSCPYCRSSYDKYNDLEKAIILINLIETKSDKIDIDYALYYLCDFICIKRKEELRLFYLQRSNYSSTYNELGCYYWKKDKDEKAIEFFKKGADKKDPMCIINLAEEYFKNTEKDKETKEFLLGVDNRYLNKETIDNKNFYLGIIFFRTGNFKEAKLYLEATEEEDKRKFIHLNKIYHMEGNYELAMYNIKLTKDQKLIDEYMSYDKLKRLYDNCGEESNSKKIRLINEILEGE